MAAKRRQRRNITEFVCRCVCSAYIKAIQSSHLIWCWNCVVSSGCWCIFHSSQRIHRSDRESRLYYAYRLVSAICLCVCRGLRIVDKINIYENGCRERTQTLSCRRASSVQFFLFQLLSDDTTRDFVVDGMGHCGCVLHEQNRTEHRHVHWVDQW